MRLIWATRGRDWGFRFVRSGGFSDPLPVYESAFAGSEAVTETCAHVGDRVALRMLDPEGRTDRAERVIPHEFVVFEPLAAEIHTVDDGRRLVWPLVADEFARIWNQPPPRPAAAVRA